MVVLSFMSFDLVVLSVLSFALVVWSVLSFDLVVWSVLSFDLVVLSVLSFDLVVLSVLSTHSDLVARSVVCGRLLVVTLLGNLIRRPLYNTIKYNAM